MTASSGLLAIGAIAMLAVVYVLLPIMADAYRRFRGASLVTCPENREPAAVEVDRKHVALSAAIGKAELRLSECSRWPERRDCGQECLRQLEAAPEECLVRTVIAKWYAGKFCVLCGKPMEAPQSWGHCLGLMAPDGTAMEWREIPTEKLPEVLRSHRPICWNCEVSEAFRQQHPELVIDRPAGTERTHTSAPH